MEKEKGTYLLNPLKYMRFCTAVEYAKEVANPYNATLKVCQIYARQIGVLRIFTGNLAFRANRIPAIRNLMDITDEFTISVRNNTIIMDFIINNLFIRIDDNFAEGYFK